MTLEVQKNSGIFNAMVSCTWDLEVPLVSGKLRENSFILKENKSFVEVDTHWHPSIILFCVWWEWILSTKWEQASLHACKSQTQVNYFSCVCVHFGLPSSKDAVLKFVAQTLQEFRKRRCLGNNTLSLACGFHFSYCAVCAVTILGSARSKCQK